MRMQLLMAAAGAALVLAAAPAMAGPCSDEIASLEKTLSSKDAGMGPVDTTAATDAAAATGTTATGTADTGTADTGTTQADAGQAGTTPKAGEVPQTEATPAMNEVAEGKATSPQDVQAQNQGQPTAADAAQGETSEVGRSSPGQASDLLKQAKDLDQAGKEDECMAAIDKAKGLAGAPAQ